MFCDAQVGGNILINIMRIWTCSNCGFNFDNYIKEDQKVPKFYGLCWKCLEKKEREYRFRKFKKITEWIK